MAESFFATLKTEFYYRRVWPTASKIAVSEAALGDLCGLDGVETDGVAQTVSVPGDAA